MAQIKDIFSRLYKLVFDIFFYSAAISVILGLLPDHLFTRFSQFKPVAYQNDHLFRGLEGQPWNDDLVSKAKLIGVDELYGPESMHVIGDYVYTGLADGRLVRVHKDSEQIEEIVNFGNAADGCAPGVISKLVKCGRVLGLRHHTDGYLYLVESGSGVYRVNLTTKTKEQLKWKGQTKGAAIYNDLVFDPTEDGLLYVSVSSEKWNLDQISWSIVEHDTTGYVLAVDLKTGKASKVTDGHALLNGVEISADKKHLLFTVTNDYAIKKIPLKDVREAIKSGKVVPESKVTLFGKLLPGEPDNIRLDETTGDILVGMFTTRPDSKLFRDYLTNWPFTRKALARTAYTLSVVLQYVHDNLYPNHGLETVIWDLYSGHIVYKLLPKRDGAVIKLDGVTGEVKRILGSSKFNSVSEAIVDAATGDLYYGSFRNTFIGRIKKGDH